MVQLDEEIFKLLEDGSNIQYEQPQRAKEIFFEAQSRAQALENHKLNIVAGFNLGTVLINNGEPRNGVEQLLKALDFELDQFKTWGFFANRLTSDVTF